MTPETKRGMIEVGKFIFLIMSPVLIAVVLELIIPLFHPSKEKDKK